jgi:hypothetical protein
MIREQAKAAKAKNGKPRSTSAGNRCRNKPSEAGVLRRFSIQRCIALNW